MRTDRRLDATARRRFAREARIIAALRHPNIVDIYYQDEWNGIPYFAITNALPVILVGGGSILVSRDLSSASEVLRPEHASVANAIGAITSNVVVKRQLRIIPDEEGGFLIEGLAGVRHFKKFEDADAFARLHGIASLVYLLNSVLGLVLVMAQDQGRTDS